ncbi:3-hydroxy-3-methylglutaryl coenzyme A synthase [Tilletia horrida]|uniref:Hydroxymethylglutaryl-CoA synthase n=1 Tax=Tilletia horrida TaxID=155126 RepID=A0AAN6JPN0_9BASI|nr:3-hydroxy-3-methylglutaryl coenzyme A synthase [Tilletia horrida]KAK0533406.1 3-hydroxy-3-methylglutaryl coenzyme A synthase [Tilletia horrida]KAK0541214.1 3-hydroxy-3-methylglutaryl coenzyme A synthase [Tilletia horrida]KAK0561874.1 3-hydroxy-3-methylglutaryl coenzyme A synthase [Tilletia horrida]
MSRPANVGIKALEVYFPRTAISEADLEKHDGASTGKYTIGFGQEYMCYSSDKEDIYSYALNAVSQLLTKYNIDPKSIGRLEVGTETIIDKAKAVKTVLMDLFKESGNDDIEGVDSKNACYGGSAAIFNAVNWVESSSWDGRDAIVVAGDIAIYAEGAARPVGGAGAIAVLIGPDAPIVFEPVHGTHMSNVWDFYKPDLTSEYPFVDGPLTLECYLGALDKSYNNWRRNVAKRSGSETEEESVAKFDYCLFHAPYGKLVQKAFARLLYNDWARGALPNAVVPEGTSKTAKIVDKAVEKIFTEVSKPDYKIKIAPTTAAPKKLGNTYSASLWMGLASLIADKTDDELVGKRLSLFTYGSGCASTFFAGRITAPLSEMRKNIDLIARLDAIKVQPVSDYIHALELREKNHLIKNYKPEGSLDDIWPGAFYLENVDDMFRRTYAKA